MRKQSTWTLEERLLLLLCAGAASILVFLVALLVMEGRR